ncbi:MAG: hypothetical protein PHQ31_02735 [Acidaminococcaceae bacterium]|nr:hypothetical protein [Acidaminococcaceae bacterium]
MYRKKIQLLAETALLAAFITISGAFKLPGLLPGTEFQLSAPLAVAVCGVFGIRKYLAAGILSSAVGLLLGTQNVFNVLIAMIFRIVVAVIYYFFGSSRFFYLASGPIASLLARLSLASVVGKAALPLVATAAPGMLYTALSAGLIAAALKKVLAAGTLSASRH